MAELRGQTAIVTGAGRGIGRAIAQALGAQGANIVLCGRSVAAMETLAGELRLQGTRPLVVSCDVRHEPEVERVVSAALEAHGQIDLLVNDAGVGGPTALARDVSAADWHETMDINLTGAFFCAKHVSKPMIERRRGNIVNIASVAGRVGFAMRTPYAASKWGMIGLSHSLAAELGPHGIRVNAVVPGPVDGERYDTVIDSRAAALGITPQAAREGDRQNIPLGRAITPQEVAAAVLFLASDASSGITGQALNVCGGFRMQ